MIVHIGTQLMIMIKYIFYNRKDLIYISKWSNNWKSLYFMV